MCCFCFHTMTGTGWMLSKCDFTWAIKRAVMFLFCNDTSVDAAFKGIGLFCSFIYWNAAQFLSITPKCLSIISYDSFLPSFSLWIARIIFYLIFLYFLGIKSLHLPWCFLPPFLPTPAVLLLAAAKEPCLPGSLALQTGVFYSASSSSHSLGQVGFVIS